MAFTQNNWAVRFDNIGTFSSPRVTDLNNDGVGDVILGAGREEFLSCDSAVMALDGITGEMLWNVSAIDQVYGSATLKDINNDGVKDVFIGGRSAELIAINGRSGEVFWRFDKKTKGLKWYNFYNPQFIPDQDNDGIEDILISNGGNVMAEPYDTTLRYPGYLVVVGSKDGKLLSKAMMPDHKEIYMSVAALPNENLNEYKVVFGTGGETIGGNLFVTTLADILNGDISNARKLDSTSDRGYIGPPAWIDITRDGYPDIIANGVKGKLLAFDGKTYDRLWSVNVANTEAYSSIAPGYFAGGDAIPDILVSYASGQWPKLEWSKQIMVNGANGKIEFIDSLGNYQTSTPVILDMNNDGWDEAILSVNAHVYDEYNNRTLQNILVYLDFRNNDMQQIGGMLDGNNISSTPWIGDMDDNGLLDIVYCHATSLKKAYTFDGMQVNRMDTSNPIYKKIVWGSYMGSYYDGIFKEQ
ncbi:MAG: hypothetical protein O2887_07485 [Bacteroidetes bacterium]|nr:hypothetical protein [Bacteroidota bacterium]MDA1120322.1 hypothetical protein [Bacteroidota bacterium]